jgi:hypothetical protein
MVYQTRKSQIRTLKQGDNNFTIIDGVMTAPRAGFEISNNCPAEYKSIFITAINAGWIKPVANVTERELIFMGLTNNQ